MVKSNAFNEYIGLIGAWLRHLENKWAQGDDQKLAELVATDDYELIKKWLWIVVIIAGPAVYIAAPLLLAVIQLFLSQAIVQLIWLLLKGMMAGVFAFFLLAIYLTLKSAN